MLVNEISRLRPHVVSLGNHGELMSSGDFPTRPEEIEYSVQHMLKVTKDWRTRRVMLYAHGGTVDEASATTWASRQLDEFLQAEIYPFFFVWHSDPITIFKNYVSDEVSRRLELESTKFSVQPYVDRFIENVAKQVRNVTWLKMKENATKATTSPEGAARQLALALADKIHNKTPIELHLTGHSAGGVFHAPLTQYLTGQGSNSDGLDVTLKTVNLWAPGCTNEVFKTQYQPTIQNGSIERFSLFTLTDAQEVGQKTEFLPIIKYQGSILYLVSKSFEPNPDTPILGMEKWVKQDNDISDFLTRHNAWHISGGKLTNANDHGAFDDDPLTIESTIKIMRGEL